MIKVRTHPRRGVVALRAGLREPGLHMVGLRRTLEIFQVAADAGGIRAGQVVVAVHVALRALHRRVGPGQREAGGRVIKRRVQPTRRAVALLAGLREARTDVIGVRGPLEILQVAADTSCIRAGQIVVAIHVALGALHAAVRAGQREAGGRVIKIRARPCRRVVALLAGLRKTGLHVVGLRRSLEILQMAAYARRVRAGQSVIAIHVALGALHTAMRTRQGEAGG